jgi:hypothetical protein
MKEVKEFCVKHKISEEQFYGKEIIKGNFKSESSILPAGINLIVAGNMYINSVRKLYENTVLISTGDIYLRNLQTLPDNVIISAEGGIYLKKLFHINGEVDITAGKRLYIHELNYLPSKYFLTYGETLQSKNVDLIKLGNKQYITNICI